MNVKEFLSNVYKDAQIAHESGDEITNEDYQRGLRNLNYVIRSMNVGRNLITYRTSENLTFVPGQETYNVNFVEIDVIYFLLSSSVRYIIYKQDIGSYYRKSVVINANAIPNIYFGEPRSDFTIDLNIYFKPNENYPFTIHGLRAFSELGINDTFPPGLYAHEMYLNYATGVRLRNVMGMEPNALLNELCRIEYLRLLSARDYDTYVEGPRVGKGRGRTWADVNLGRGYRPNAR